MKKILLVEDDLTYSRIVKNYLEKNGFEVNTCEKVQKGKQLLSDKHFDLIIADFRLPDGTGMELLSWTKENHPQTQIILITHYSDIRIAIKAMKLGAFEYITKPIDPEELLATVNESLSNKSLKHEASPHALVEKKPIPTKKGKNSGPDYILGTTPEAKQLEEHIQLVAPTDLSVLVLGDTGSGKELISQRIHEFSHRKDQPFVAIDCGALPKELAGSELFGHVKGAFTGALDNKTGHFERANGGTIFLDEVGNLTYEVQIQLLRAIQERKIRKIGGSQEINLDIRIIAATNENLLHQAGAGQFREDLYHRLNEFTLEAIPLRQRKDDLQKFADHFLAQSNQAMNKNVQGFSEEVWSLFLNYDWPGNFRELKNIIKRAVLLTKGSHIEKEAIPTSLRETIQDFSGHHPDLQPTAEIPVPQNPLDYKSQMEAQEKKLIEKVLMETRFNKSKTARILKMDRKTLYSKMEKYDMH
ncbi:sigma-54-dependent transcriptional regulator [Algoriphagus namhaensis]